MTVNYVQVPDFLFKGQPAYTAVTLTYKFGPITSIVSKTAVTLSGSCPGLINVEVQDASGKLLARLTPDVYGNFSGSISTTAIAAGSVTWTIYGWDSAPGVAFTNSDSVAFTTTIAH